MSRIVGDPAAVEREAALVVLVPEVEDLVGRFRHEHDPSASVGVPAHITINYPFIPGASSNPDLRDRLRSLFAEAAPFDYALSRLARFPDVLYLEPDPEAPFLDLARRVLDRFPESPPYGGAFSELVPHLTIADTDDEEVLVSLEAELTPLLAPKLPIACRAEQVWLIDNGAGLWQQRMSFALGRVKKTSEGDD